MELWQSFPHDSGKAGSYPVAGFGRNLRHLPCDRWKWFAIWPWMWAFSICKLNLGLSWLLIIYLITKSPANITRIHCMEMELMNRFVSVLQSPTFTQKQTFLGDALAKDGSDQEHDVLLFRWYPWIYDQLCNEWLESCCFVYPGMSIMQL